MSEPNTPRSSFLVTVQDNFLALRRHYERIHEYVIKGIKEKIMNASVDQNYVLVPMDKTIPDFRSVLEIVLGSNFEIKTVGEHIIIKWNF